MTNPATTLLDLFTAWRADGQSPFVVRKFNLAEDEGVAYKEHEAAIRAIADISRALDGLEKSGYRVGHFRRSMKLFIAALLNLPHDWHMPGVQLNTLNDHLIDMLEALEGFLDSNMPRLGDVGEARVSELLDEVIAALDEDDELSQILREHLIRTVQVIRDCIEEYGVSGETDLKQALYDLWIALYAAAGATTGTNQTRWQNFATKIGYPTAASILGSIPSLGVSILQLTQGASG